MFILQTNALRNFFFRTRKQTNTCQMSWKNEVFNHLHYNTRLSDDVKKSKSWTRLKTKLRPVSIHFLPFSKNEKKPSLGLATRPHIFTTRPHIFKANYDIIVTLTLKTPVALLTIYATSRMKPGHIYPGSSIMTAMVEKSLLVPKQAEYASTLKKFEVILFQSVSTRLQRR